MLAKMPQGIARLLETFSHRDSAAWHAALPEIPHDVSHDPPEMGKRTGIDGERFGSWSVFWQGMEPEIANLVATWAATIHYGECGFPCVPNSLNIS